MNDPKHTVHFIEELSGRALLIVFTVLSASKQWWMPLVVAPVLWQFWDLTAGRRSRIGQRLMKLIADGITWLVWLSYIIYSTVSFGLNLGHWYGWLIGIAIGLVVAQFLGLLWPHRWHLERVEGNL